MLRQIPPLSQERYRSIEALPQRQKVCAEKEATLNPGPWDFEMVQDYTLRTGATINAYAYLHIPASPFSTQ
ncbi:MAG: hypothetical protein JNK95_02715 [Candidatus Competibacter sp.]|nr:hypothetical protein [Candidatus Competibacter sp.]